ncbi:MAG: hypothetical protein DRH23_10425, partial [Deltaproteobacteria bacterium]
GPYVWTTYTAQRGDDTVEVRIAAEDGERARPERTIDIVVVTDSATFEGSGSETSTIVVSLE